MMYDDVARPIKKNVKGNLIKWWDVNMVPSESPEEVMNDISEDINDEALAIYERLMREAEEDEMKKQKEIEEVLRLSEAN